MEWIMLILGLLIGLLAGVAVGFYLAHNVAGRSSLHSDLESSRIRLEQARTELGETQRHLAAAQGRLQEIEVRRAEEAEASSERESLLEILHPVRQGVTDMQRRIQELERERSAQHAALSQQLASAARSDAQLLESTRALLGSLHSSSARGHWGEVQLRRVVEAAGMLRHVDFTEQHAGTGTEGQVLRPDMVVHLPGGRQLIIDAKAPLNPTEPLEQAKALRSRVDELSKKRYWEAVELSPDVVFCFVPAESLLSAALDADPGLLDGALAKGVTLVSPASLLASLKAVESAWRQERLAANIAEVVEHSRELHRRLAKLSEHLGRTGDRLRQAVEAYNGLIGNIERQVLPKVEAMGRLHVADGAESESTALEDLGETLKATPVTAEVNPLGPRLRSSSE